MRPSLLNPATSTESNVLIVDKSRVLIPGLPIVAAGGAEPAMNPTLLTIEELSSVVVDSVPLAHGLLVGQELISHPGLERAIDRAPEPQGSTMPVAGFEACENRHHWPSAGSPSMSEEMRP